MVAPGTYTVRLTIGEWSESAPLVVREDPRAVKDGVTLADLAAQLEHNVRTRDLLSEVNRLVARVNTSRERAQGDTLAKLDALRAKLVTPAVRYSKPELQAHIAYLYSMTNQADQKVGRDAILRYRDLRKALDARQAEYRAITGEKDVVQ